MSIRLLATIGLVSLLDCGRCQLREVCLDRSWSQSPAADRSRIVDASLGSAIAFTCNYCDETDGGEARLWYKSLRHSNGTDGWKEVTLGMADPVESNRMYMTSDHSLVIMDLISSDVGRYSCSGLGSDHHVEFALDLLPRRSDRVADLVSADSMAGWMQYESRYLKYVAKKFPQIRQIEVDWEAWGPCDGCSGKRYRRAACRVRIDSGTRMACRHRFPKYRNTFVLEEGSSLTLVCAEATIDDKVTWRKDGLLLTESSAHDVTGTFLDTFGTLYLIGLGSSDSGNYTCYINNNRTQEVLVSVHKSSIFESKAYGRHFGYLCYVLAMYFVVFGARIYYAYLGRRRFLKITENDVLRSEIPTAYLGKQIRIR